MEDLTGFGQFSHDLLQLLSDDYPRSPIMLYALRMPQLSVEDPSHTVNLPPHIYEFTCWVSAPASGGTLLRGTLQPQVMCVEPDGKGVNYTGPA